ncbi:MAG: F0F1 ATP synthase subunit B [Firmicutes bacterium]|nr:F0F1 ATP synthase subunit B [Bacillota bacterium]
MLYQQLVSFDKWTFIAQILNLFIQIWLFKRFLFQPVKKIIAKRQEELNKVYSDAEAARSEAEDAKLGYEEQLKSAKADAEALSERTLASARRSAGEIISEAQTQAQSIKEKAAKEIEADRKKVMDQARGEISDMAVEIAEKLVRKELDDGNKGALIDQFINEFEAE